MYERIKALAKEHGWSIAKISSIRLNEEEHKAEVFLKPEEVSLAIGKEIGRAHV